MTDNQNGAPRQPPGDGEPLEEGFVPLDETQPIEPEAVEPELEAIDEETTDREPAVGRVTADAMLAASTSRSSWFGSMVGGVFSTLMVFVFLGYLQPTMGSSEVISLPDIVQLQTGLGANRKPPPPPKQQSRQKPKRKPQSQRPKQVVRQTAPRSNPTRAPQSSSRFMTSMGLDLGIGMGPGGGAVVDLAMQLDEGLDEESEQVREYLRTRDQVRSQSRRGVGGFEDSAVTAGIREPQVLLKPEDIYPRQARKDAIEGFVLLNALISVSGSIIEFEILGAQPEGVFEDAVIDSLHRWRFSPAEDGNGRPMEFWKRLKIDFELEK